MVIRFNSKTSANEPLVSSDSAIGQQILERSELFASSSQQFLECMQSLVQTLDGQIQEQIGFQGPDNFNRFGSYPVTYVWQPEGTFDYPRFASAASIAYEAWYVARRISADVDSFDGSKLEPLVRLFQKIGRGLGLRPDSAAFSDIPTLFFTFQVEVVRLEVFLSLKFPQEKMPSQKSHASQVAGVPNIGEPDAKVPDAVASAEVLIEGAETAAEVLPFGLQRCDVRQTLKRAEFRPVTIRNEVHWNLMQALMAAYPNALSEKTKKELFKFPNEQGNAKRLRPVLYDLGLTFHEWTLMEWDGDR